MIQILEYVLLIRFIGNKKKENWRFLSTPGHG